MPKLFKKNVISLFFILLIILFLSFAKDNFIFLQLGDHAIFAQVVDNLINSMQAKSNIFAALQYLIDNEIAHYSLADLDSMSLAGQDVKDRFLFYFHADFIVYLIGILALVVGSDISIIFLQLVNIFFLYLFIFNYLAKEHISKVIILIFIILTFVNPLISGNLLGQFYPDRLFIAPMFLLLIILNRVNINYFYVFLLFFLILSINERASIYLSLAFSYTFLIRNYETITRGLFNFTFKKFLYLKEVKLLYFAFFSITYFILIKYLLLTNLYYSSFLPSSISELFYRLGIDSFQSNIFFFIINMLPFLFLSYFNKKFFILTVIAIIPNLIGNIGGAEKVGWFTHYHSYYIPFLFFSSIMGVKEIFFLKKKKLIFSFFILITVISLSILSKYGYYHLKQTYGYINNIISLSINDPFKKLNIITQINEVVQPGDTVSTNELGMNLLHSSDVNFYFFPVQYKNSDLIFLPCLDPDNPKYQNMHLNNLILLKKIPNLTMCFYKNND